MQFNKVILVTRERCNAIMIIPINSDEFMTTIPTVNTKSVQLNVLNIMTLVMVLEYPSAAHYGLGGLTYELMI